MNCVTEQVTSRVKEKQQHQMHFLVSLSGKNLVPRESQQECGENIDGTVEGRDSVPVRDADHDTMLECIAQSIIL
jgi:hypothetical protein